mmetsp:Transcript_2466/g.7398  ORF Transcript_2466/g.7398 Transcript_2466/m.7398 type:complete len:281 (-) Transcript_2466:945-1787(-)
MISRWHDHTSLMASGVPMPAPRGSPAGPNQWFWGAPVVRPRMPAYVVPFTVLASTCCVNRRSLDTTAAVRCCDMRSTISSTLGSCSSLYSVTTWKGPNSSVLTRSQLLSLIWSRGTNTAVGCMAPYTSGMLCPFSGSPPHITRAPGMAATLLTWSSMRWVVHDSTGPTVRSSIVRDIARFFSIFSSPALAQFLCMKSRLVAEHFWPVQAYASWSHCHATYASLLTSGPRIFQSNPASSRNTLPFKSTTSCSATAWEPVNRVLRRLPSRKILLTTRPLPCT